MAAVPIVEFGRFLIAVGAGVYANWDEITSLFERVEIEEAAPIYGYRYVAVIGERDGASGVWTQRAQYGVHFVNVTSGDPDYTWTSADFAAIESGSEALWTALAAIVPQSYRLEEHRWYAFGPGVSPPNPVHRFVTLATPITGSDTGGTHMPTATACTIKTVLRKHWGRFYFPLSAGGELDVAGRLTSTKVDAQAAAFRTFLLSGSGQGVFPVVWDANAKVVHGMTSLQVDDIPDTIRRRRQSVTQYRKTYTA
jgi:hypothetical protein